MLFSLATILLVQLSYSQENQTFCENFVSNVPPTSLLCDNYKSFLTSIPLDRVQSISVSNVTYASFKECTNGTLAVSIIENSIDFNSNDTRSVTCDGNIWNTWNRNNYDGSICVNQDCGKCGGGDFVIRPCTGTTAWGGIGGNSCDPPSQQLCVSVTLSAVQPNTTLSTNTTLSPSNTTSVINTTAIITTTTSSQSTTQISTTADPNDELAKKNAEEIKKLQARVSKLERDFDSCDACNSNNNRPGKGGSNSKGKGFSRFFDRRNYKGNRFYGKRRYE